MAAIIDNPTKPARPKARGWLGACAIAVLVAIFVWTAWPAGGMSAEDFKRMYEGGTPEDAASPPPVFP